MASPYPRRFRMIRRKLPPMRTIIPSSLAVTSAESRLLLGIAVQALIEHVT